MHLQRKIFLKWLIITILCGAQSFVWGFMLTEQPLAMLLGMLTLIVMFSVIESHPAYQARRAAKPFMARALDIGLKIRVGIGVGIPLIGWLVVMAGTTPTIISQKLNFVPAWEMMVGMGATFLTKFITGIDLMERTRGIGSSPPAAPIGEDQLFFATYTNTLITGILHTLILAALCALVWGVIRVRNHQLSKIGNL